MSRQSTYKRVRSAVDKKKTEIIIQYMKENWDVVLNSSVTVMKGLRFPTRFRFAMEILFGKKKRAMKAIRNKIPGYPPPGVKDAGAAPPRPDVTPPPQNPQGTQKEPVIPGADAEVKTA